MSEILDYVHVHVGYLHLSVRVRTDGCGSTSSLFLTDRKIPCTCVSFKYRTNEVTV